MKTRVRHRSDHQLGDPIARLNAKAFSEVVINQHDLDFSPISGIDHTGRINQTDAVFEGQPTSGHHQRGKPGWEGNGSSSGHQHPLPRLEGASLRGAQISSGITGVGILRDHPVNKDIRRLGYFHVPRVYVVQ